jgi:hypothetical protein
MRTGLPARPLREAAMEKCPGHRADERKRGAEEGVMKDLRCRDDSEIDTRARSYL